MRLTPEQIDEAALLLWAEVFRVQCCLPTDKLALEHVTAAECIANVAERTFRERCAKGAK